MSTAAAATIYEKHIKSLAPEERLELLAIIAREIAAEGVPSAKKPQHSIMELEGLGKEIWEGVDSDEYVERLRGEWPKTPS